MQYLNKNRMANIPLSNEELITKCSSIGATSPISTVSEKYSFVPTLSVVNLLRDVGWYPVQCSQTNAREEKDGFQKHMIRFTKGEQLDEQSRFDVVLYNSHDKGSAFNLVAAVYRLVCSNGLMVGNEVSQFKHRHMGFNAEEFISSSRQIASQFTDIQKTVNQWQAIDLTPDERGVFALSASELISGENKTVDSRSLLQVRRFDDRRGDLWTTFNTVQENVIKGGSLYRNANNQRRHAREVKSLDKNVKLNKALWTLAEQMAQLKSQDIAI